MTNSVPTVAVLAEQAAAAVHQLALLTRPAVTTLDVEQLSATTGALADLAAALPQTLRQLQGYLTDSYNQEGHLAIAVDPASDCLRQAGTVATHLAAVLDAAHQTLGDLAETTETTPRGQFSTGVDIGERSDSALTASFPARRSPKSRSDLVQP
jgi:hypothetical protein